MNKYEVMFIINPELSEEDTQATVEKFKAMLEAAGTVENFAEWGKRRLAYPIQDYTDGYYVVADFEAAPDFPAELDRVMKIHDSVMRHLITRRDEE